MGLLMSDDLFEAQLVRALGYAPYGGADLGECLATVARIRKVEPGLWYTQWFATASAVRQLADASARNGETVSARLAYFRASNYFRTAGLFLLGAPLDAQLVEAHRLEVESFRLGAALLDLPPRRIEIPYEDTKLPGYFFPAISDSAKRPVLILTNGYDGTAEELYFATGAAALLRGYHVLTFDGPGQGAVILDQGIPFRPDWENVIRPVVDFTLTLPGIDEARIALMGLSFGGYLAPRAATVEHRLAACISDCGPYDLFDASASRLPALLARQLPNGNPFLLAVLDRVLKGVITKPTMGWALRRNLLVHALENPLAFFRIAPAYSLKGREHLIKCPTFVCSAEHDDLSVNAPRLYDALVCEKAYVQFKTADGAGEHCESGARTAFHQRVFAWLDAVLSVSSAVDTSASSSLGSS